jgi:hypothetical protein
MMTFLGFGLWDQTSITQEGLFVSPLGYFKKALSFMYVVFGLAVVHSNNNRGY